MQYIKRIFVFTIVSLTILSFYIVYIKDNNKQNSVQAKSKEIKFTKEINIGITKLDTINPILTKKLEIQHITKLIYEPLINISQDFNTTPCIAEECSKLDNLTYIIKLNENKKWSNGRNVTVEDVEFTINTIKNSDSIYKENTVAISGIEKIDQYTFKINLVEPVEFFEYLLCFPIMEASTYNSTKPMGTGEYKITNIEKDEISIEGSEIKIKLKIYKNTTELYNEFTRKNVDLIITENTDYEKYIGNIGIEENLITAREFYYISCENIKNEETRKYLNKNINKEKIIYDLYNKKYSIVDFPLEYGSYLNKQNTLPEDVIDITGEIFTLSTIAENKEIAKKIKEQLEEKNIKIEIQTYQNSNADLILKTRTVPITPEISQYFDNKETREKIEKIIQIEDKEILKKEYEKIIENYYKELPFISLYFNNYIILHTDKLKGDFSGNWYNMFYNINTWYKIL